MLGAEKIPGILHFAYSVQNDNLTCAEVPQGEATLVQRALTR